MAAFIAFGLAMILPLCTIGPCAAEVPGIGALAIFYIAAFPIGSFYSILYFLTPMCVLMQKQSALTLTGTTVSLSTLLIVVLLPLMLQGGQHGS